MGENNNNPVDFEIFNQTWPTESEIAEADRNQKQKNLKKRILPRGTSEYQVYFTSTLLSVQLFISFSVNIC